MQVIFSCENTDYMRWQAELLWYTYTKVGMRAQLTALVSRTKEPIRGFTCSTAEVGNYKNHSQTGVYTPLNKPGGIAEWVASCGIEEETILIVDPDSVFVGRVPDPGPLQKGVAHAERHDYMDINLPMSQTVLRRHCDQNRRVEVQPVGIYIAINKTDLEALAPLWLQKSIDIRNDQICCSALPDEGWISEMWGYAIAAAELGIRHHITNFSQVTGSNCLQHPIIHYCFALQSELSPHANVRDQTPSTVWSKWDYQPWQFPGPVAAATIEGKVLLENLSELARARSH